MHDTTGLVIGNIITNLAEQLERMEKYERETLDLGIEMHLSVDCYRLTCPVCKAWLNMFFEMFVQRRFVLFQKAGEAVGH